MAVEIGQQTTVGVGGRLYNRLLGQRRDGDGDQPVIPWDPSGEVTLIVKRIFPMYCHRHRRYDVSQVEVLEAQVFPDNERIGKEYILYTPQNS